ncbi:MAG: hypothetical protein AAGF87_08930 [Bacteroidota bacterium]
MLETDYTRKPSTEAAPRAGCLAWGVFMQTAFLSFCAVLYLTGLIRGLDDFLLLALFAAIPIGAFQFVLGIVQYIRSRRYLLGFYTYFSAGYLAIFWLVPIYFSGFEYFGILTTVLPLALGWLLTYIQFYVPVGPKIDLDDRLEDILDA